MNNHQFTYLSSFIIPSLYQNFWDQQWKLCPATHAALYSPNRCVCPLPSHSFYFLFMAVPENNFYCRKVAGACDQNASRKSDQVTKRISLKVSYKV